MSSGGGTLERIRKRVRQLASVIHAPERYLPTFGSTEDGGRPHVEVIGVGELPYYVVIERGQELVRDAFPDESALMERIFASVTHDMAIDFERENRQPDHDFRRVMFAKQLELLAMLEPNWAAHRRADILQILRVHPFSDDREPRDALDPPK